MTILKENLKGAYTNEVKHQQGVARAELKKYKGIDEKPPKYLSEVAKKVYIETISASKKDNLKQIDRGLLATYSQTYANVIDATEHIKADGLVIEKNTTNPYTRIFNQQTALLTKLASQLGITPNARAKQEMNNAKNHESENKSDPFMEVIGG